MSRARPRLGSLLTAVVMCGLASSLALGTRGVARAQPPSAPPDVNVAITVEPEEPRVGERVVVNIEVEHAADRLVTMRSPLTRSPVLELITSELPATLPAGERFRTTFAFVLQPFALGSIELGSVGLQLLAEDGSAQEFSVRMPALQVRTTLDPERASLRPLKPQASIDGAPAAWERPALVGGITAGVAIVVLVVVFAIRRRLRRSAVPFLAPLPPAIAEDDARRQLDALRAHDLLSIPDLETYYGRLSIAVRSYLQERFDFRATALTTHELERRMGAEGLDRWQARLVSGLLERCDAAVYAGVYPPLASADHDLTVAYEIVELARPRRETEPQAVSA